MLRSDRVSEEIKKVAAEIIQNEIEDPRLPDFTTVTAVEVTRDLSYATIYVSALGDGDQIQTTLDVMESAKKFIRYRVGQEVRLRNVPELRFKYDNSIAEGNRMSKIIDEVIAQDNLNRQSKE
ncbi:MAG: 30S ribosome-binding factor RbfA [Clostridiaceae bacterium]|jgi:ribosome-binding factor A|nr:30S ribosome-binding factor RbfA [Bacillota bacterium]NLN52300.1 30S ribosome-binding factor RbfA [Clostridiaceae bacterium]